jgi:hypothetical protein
MWAFSRFEKSVQINVSTIVVGNEVPLVIELKDDPKQHSNEAIGLATCRNFQFMVLATVNVNIPLTRHLEMFTDIHERDNDKTDRQRV